MRSRKIREISQQDNVNAAAKIWIMDDGTIFKEYVIRNNTYHKNVRNLLRIAHRSDMYSLSEIAMPIHIYAKGLSIRGYSMPYCQGTPIGQYLADPDIDPSTQLRCLVHLGKVIHQLPNDIFIGDLHGDNVLVEHNGDIHIIDIDGFSTSECGITCPLTANAIAGDIPRIEKYYHRSGKFRISRDSDIFCFYLLLLGWLSKENTFRWSRSELSDYLEYLKSIGFPDSIYNKIHRLYSEKPNVIDMGSLRNLSLDLIDLCNYSAYITTQQKRIIVKEREKMSLRDRVNQLDQPGTFEGRANEIAEREAAGIISRIEDSIKRTQYEVSWGKKRVRERMYTSIDYCVGNRNHYSDSPRYYGGSVSCYFVNNEHEARYLINAIKSRLEKEGCVCKVESSSDTYSNGIGFWGSLFKGFTTRYTYNISCIFEWRK